MSKRPPQPVYISALLALACFLEPTTCFHPIILPAPATLPSTKVDQWRAKSATFFSSTSELFGALNGLAGDETTWKQEGERIIRKAAVEAGAKDEMISVNWKSDRIVVTVDGSAFIPASDYDEADEIEFDDEDELDDEEFGDEGGVELAETEEEEKVDVVAIARAINAAFDEAGEGSIGYTIAVQHSIEVTTPGASDELTGVMFEAYRGFDVILEAKDPKTGKIKRVEGKLVEKDDEFIRINQKGRPRKFKHEDVESVKLPKAKKEKGVGSK